MNTNELILEIENLIATKREDDYWDFKQKHHASNVNLVHDIICMANNRVNRDAYIIFGVEDKTCKILGVENDENRKNQQQLINLLKSREFAGGIRPKIEMHTISLSNHEIDVLIVKNTMDTPYYLVKEFKDNKHRKVRANHIYTRVCDSNTDIDKSADLDQVEYLWKKRFGLHLTPLDRFSYLLNDHDNWVYDKKRYYNKTSPEYTIYVNYDNCDEEYAPEFYAYVMIKKTAIYGEIKLNYYGTTLFSDSIVSLDGGRYEIVTPSWGRIDVDRVSDKFTFKYYIKNDLEYNLNEFLFTRRNARYSKENFIKVILIFNNENEKISFLDYVRQNINRLEHYMSLENHYEYLKLENQSETKYVIEKISCGIVLNKMLTEFKDEVVCAINDINQ